MHDYSRPRNVLAVQQVQNTGGRGDENPVAKEEVNMLYTILCYTILYYTILYYTILYYTILYYTVLYYNTTLYRERRGGGGETGVPHQRKTLFNRAMTVVGTLSMINHPIVLSYGRLSAEQYMGIAKIFGEGLSPNFEATLFLLNYLYLP